MDTLTTIDTARRLLRSHGIDDAHLAAAAKERLAQYRLSTSWTWEDMVRAWDDDHPSLANPSPDEADGAEQARDAALAELRREFDAQLWLNGSVAQLQRQWGGRCVSCANWDTSPMDDGAPYGFCQLIVDRSTDTLVKAGRVSIETFAPFGCILWAEIAADDVETLRARAEIAMALGLLPRMPETASE